MGSCRSKDLPESYSDIEEGDEFDHSRSSPHPQLPYKRTSRGNLALDGPIVTGALNEDDHYFTQENGHRDSFFSLISMKRNSSSFTSYIPTYQTRSNTLESRNGDYRNSRQHSLSVSNKEKCLTSQKNGALAQADSLRRPGRSTVDKDMIDERDEEELLSLNSFDAGKFGYDTSPHPQRFYRHDSGRHNVQSDEIKDTLKRIKKSKNQ